MYNVCMYIRKEFSFRQCELAICKIYLVKSTTEGPEVHLYTSYLG